MTKAFARNEQLLDLVNKSTNHESVKPDLEKWLNEVAVKNDELLKKVRDYLEICPKTDNASQRSKVPSTQMSSKISSSLRSNTSSQRQKDLILAKQKREEIEEQNEAALRVTQQKQELEIKRMQRNKSISRKNLHLELPRCKKRTAKNWLRQH